MFVLETLPNCSSAGSNLSQLKDLRVQGLVSREGVLTSLGIMSEDNSCTAQGHLSDGCKLKKDSAKNAGKPFLQCLA